MKESHRSAQVSNQLIRSCVVNSSDPRSNGVGVVPTQAALSAELAHLRDTAVHLRIADVESSTEKTYATLNRKYTAFCRRLNLDPFAPATVALYIADRLKATESANTLNSRLAAIARLALRAGRDDPTTHPDVATVAQNAKKQLRIARAVRRVAPAMYEDLWKLVCAVYGVTPPTTSAGRVPPADRLPTELELRDTALVLFGYALGKRGSELARVDLEHVNLSPAGALVLIPWTKTNKSGEPETIGVPRFDGDTLCPLAALEAYLAFMSISAGPVFRTINAIEGRGGNRLRREDVSRRLDAIATRAGLPGIFRSHSLRRGVVTDAEQRGVARSRTRLLTGWKTDAMFAVYADHREKIVQSPLHEIYGKFPPQTGLNMSGDVR